MKKSVKNFVWAGSGVGAVFFLAWAGFFVWNRFTEQRIATEIERALAARDTEEIEVGETPQETFSFFLGALRENDFDHAVQYFVPELRDGWRVHLQDIRDRKFLDAMIADLENMEEDSPLPEDHFRQTNGQWRLVSL